MGADLPDLGLQMKSLDEPGARYAPFSAGSRVLVFGPLLNVAAQPAAWSLSGPELSVGLWTPDQKAS